MVEIFMTVIFNCHHMKWKNPTNLWNVTSVFSKNSCWAHILHGITFLDSYWQLSYHEIEKPYKCLKSDFSFPQKRAVGHTYYMVKLFLTIIGNCHLMKWRHPTNIGNVALLFSKKYSWAHIVHGRTFLDSYWQLSSHEMKKPYKCLKCDFGFLQKE